jgi:uncharacterized membrane protein YqiK
VDLQDIQARDVLFSPWLWLVVVLGVAWLMRAWRLLGIVFVPEEKTCVVTKRWTLFRPRLPNGCIVAVNGEAGLQANTLTPGLHFLLFPWQYAVHFDDLTVIQPGHLGKVTLIDGKPISPGRLLGQHVDCNFFQDLSTFLRNHGQRGPQSTVLPPGTYRLNTRAVFVNVAFDEHGHATVANHPALVVPPNMVAIITTMDGNPLPQGDIAGLIVDGHAQFQDADAFVRAGGCRGLQTQVLLSGIYYINPMFAQAEFVDPTAVPIGNAGVVISYVGPAGVDQTGEGFKHGNIVERGQRGVWRVPLDPGKYPINTRVMRVEVVPTVNFVLNWITGFEEEHGFDKNLETIVVRTKDLFDLPLEISQILHIAASNAPKVIARFGTLINLVTQVLEPVIDAWFRNAAQQRLAIEFIENRQSIQDSAADYIRNELAKYDVEGVATLIGDTPPPEKLATPRQEKQVAEQQKEMYAVQRDAQAVREQTEEQRALADTKARVVSAQRDVTVAEQEARAAVARAEGEAGAIRKIAEANAARETLVGMAQAGVLEAKVSAIGRDNWTTMDVITHLAEQHVPIVPQVVAGGGDGVGGGNVAGALLGVLAARMLRPESPVPPAPPTGSHPV